MPKRNLKAKEKRQYIVTDQCFFALVGEQDEYNPYDKGRTPHFVTLVDKENGSVVELPSGSVIEVIESYDHERETKD